jgi:hypothetical protein
MVGGGGVLSTIQVPLGPAAAAWFPARSDAVFATIEIPSVPSPVIAPIVTVLVVVPLPLTVGAPVFTPVLFSVTLAAARVIVSAPL